MFFQPRTYSVQQRLAAESGEESGHPPKVTSPWKEGKQVGTIVARLPRQQSFGHPGPSPVGPASRSVGARVADHGYDSIDGPDADYTLARWQ